MRAGLRAPRLFRNLVTGTTALIAREEAPRTNPTPAAGPALPERTQSPSGGPEPPTGTSVAQRRGLPKEARAEPRCESKPNSLWALWETGRSVAAHGSASPNEPMTLGRATWPVNRGQEVRIEAKDAHIGQEGPDAGPISKRTQGCANGFWPLSTSALGGTTRRDPPPVALSPCGRGRGEGLPPPREGSSWPRGHARPPHPSLSRVGERATARPDSRGGESSSGRPGKSDRQNPLAHRAKGRPVMPWAARHPAEGTEPISRGTHDPRNGHRVPLENGTRGARNEAKPRCAVPAGGNRRQTAAREPGPLHVMASHVPGSSAAPGRRAIARIGLKRYDHPLIRAEARSPRAPRNRPR